MRATAPPPAASFRDPDGRVFVRPEGVFRAVRRHAAPLLEGFLETAWARELEEQGKLVRSRPAEVPAEVGAAAPGCVFYEHDRIPVVSYPYEWPADMLWEAASSTLDLAEGALDHGYGLKDATPYNVLFRGHHPVFVDVLSFEKRDPLVSTWLPYAQFVRTMLLPLLMHKHFGLPPADTLLARRDGLEAEEVLRWLSVGQKLRPPFLQLVTLPSWLGSRHEGGEGEMYRPRQESSAEKARFILDSLFRGLRRALRAAMPPGGETRWTGYMGSNNYSGEQFAAKERFVAEALGGEPGRLLDAGCNTGHFSAMAARAGWQVVAVDLDAAVAGMVWRRAKAENLDILPLAVNLTRPTPAMGWFNGESASFLDRAAGSFDGLLMLALVHHMLVTERIPLPEIARLASLLTKKMAVVEYIGPEDSMFRRLTRGRDHLHADVTPEAFEAAFGAHFEVVRTLDQEGGHRRLYWFRKRAS